MQVCARFLSDQGKLVEWDDQAGFVGAHSSLYVFH